MKTWKETILRHLLAQCGLYCIYTDEEDLIREVETHHPHFLRKAEALEKVITDKLAHDAVFTGSPPE